MKHFLWAFCCMFLLVGSASAADAPRWAVYYANDKEWEAFKKYDLVVFDADKHPQVRPLTGLDKDVLAYLSLVEVEKTRPFFAKVKNAGLVLETAEDGRAIIDIRNPLWMKLLIEEIVPLYVREGFTGLMLDTVDSAMALEAKNPARYVGMGQAAVSLVRHIHLHYPYLKLMVNRGFELLPGMENDISMVLAESVYIDSRRQPARPFPEAHYNDVLKMLAAAKEENPNLRLFSLDYWNMEDGDGVKKIYEKQRESGFAPYVSTPDLQTIYAEP